MNTLVAIALVLLSVSAFGQASVSKGGRPPRVFDMHACTKCKTAADHNAKTCKCGKHSCGTQQVAIRANLRFICTHCKVEESKPGACPKCKMGLARVATTFLCEKCKTSSSQSGNCTKCGKFRAKKVFKL